MGPTNEIPSQEAKINRIMGTQIENPIEGLEDPDEVHLLGTPNKDKTETAEVLDLSLLDSAPVTPEPLQISHNITFGNLSLPHSYEAYGARPKIPKLIIMDQGNSEHDRQRRPLRKITWDQEEDKKSQDDRSRMYKLRPSASRCSSRHSK